MPLLPTLLHATAFKTPLLRTLVPTLALAYGIQAAVAAPSIAARSERFYDASGSLTYLACTGASLVLPVLRARYAAGTLGAGGLLMEVVRAQNWRQVALSAAVGLWALRCKFMIVFGTRFPLSSECRWERNHQKNDG